MPDVATMGVKTQIGVESTYQTAVAATKRLLAAAIDFAVHLETDQHYPDGNIAPSSSAIIQEWTEGDLKGILTYNEFIYMLLATFGDTTSAVAHSANGGDTSALAYDWKWSIQPNAQLTPKGLTIERGSSVYGSRAPGCVMTDLGLKWSRADKIDLSGGIYGGQLEKAFSPTVIGSNPTVPLIRCLPTQCDVYVDDTYAAAAGAAPTKQLRVFSGSLSISGLFGGVWAINSAKASFDGIIPMRPKTNMKLMFQADANGMVFLDTVRADQIKYVKIQFTGPTIDTVGGTTFKHQVSVIMPVQVLDVDNFDDADGIYAIPWTFQPIDDGTNPLYTWLVRNKLSAP